MKFDSKHIGIIRGVACAIVLQLMSCNLSDDGTRAGVIISDDPSGQIYVEPSIAINPNNDNNIVVASMIFGQKDANPELVIYMSQNGGRTWKRRFISSSDNFVGDPWVSFLDDHVVVVSCLNLGVSGGITLITSDDQGLNWDIKLDLPKYGGLGYDHPVLLALGEHGMLLSASQKRRKDQFSSNDIVMGYLSDQMTVDTILIHSEGLIDLTGGKGDRIDDDKTLLPFVEIGDNSAGYQEIIDTPIIYVLQKDHSNRRYNTVAVDTISGMGSFPTLATDKSPLSKYYGQAYIARHVYEGSRQLAFWKSIDKGDNWRRIMLDGLTSRDKEIWNVNVEVNNRGVIGLFWQELGSDDCFDHVFAYSVDGGETFIDRTLLSTVSSCMNTETHEAVAFKNGRTLADRYNTGGDYHGMTANSKGDFCFAYSALHDERLQLHFKVVSLEH